MFTYDLDARCIAKIVNRKCEKRRAYIDWQYHMSTQANLCIRIQ